MSFVAKILTFFAILCILAWVTFVAMGAQPLMESAVLKVIYGEGEDFYADASQYHKFRNDTVYFLQLPHARTSYKWWAIDFSNSTITAVPSPHSLGSQLFVLRRDQKGIAIGNKEAMGDWYWHFTEDGAAFSGNGFTCSVRRSQGR